MPDEPPARYTANATSAPVSPVTVTAPFRLTTALFEQILPSTEITYKPAYRQQVVKIQF
jgi:hypothetical protein